jgi:hypothetical protein
MRHDPRRAMAMAALETVVSTCTDGQTCPALYADDEETVIVRGYLEMRDDLAVPDGEALVRVPRSLLAEGAARLTG